MKTIEPRLTSLSHGGGCGCKIAPAVLHEILKGTLQMPIPKELMVGIATADDAAVYRLNDEQALIATTDFFMPIVDDRTSLVVSPRPMRSVMCMQWAVVPFWLSHWWACR